MFTQLIWAIYLSSAFTVSGYLSHPSRMKRYVISFSFATAVAIPAGVDPGFRERGGQSNNTRKARAKNFGHAHFDHAHCASA